MLRLFGRARLRSRAIAKVLPLRRIGKRIEVWEQREPYGHDFTKFERLKLGCVTSVKLQTLSFCVINVWAAFRVLCCVLEDNEV